MRPTKVGEHTTMLTRQRWVNCYLVREDDGLTLIDTTVGGATGAIVTAAERLGAPIVRITVTHAHGDHVGSLDALAARLPDAEVILPAREARFLRGDLSLDPNEPQKKPRVVRSACAGAAATAAVGERIGSLELVAAPGHTPGQVAFLDTRDRTLIAGDAYVTLGGPLHTTAGPSWPFPLPGLATWDRALALQTARDLRELEPARLAVGHGRPVEAPGGAMDRAIGVK
jgi:glyoxylase-like metal-dependent hydrolase (beta-lactamase superfamily II)